VSVHRTNSTRGELMPLPIEGLLVCLAGLVTGAVIAGLAPSLPLPRAVGPGLATLSIWIMRRSWRR
jgi:hypothetical protein